MKKIVNGLLYDTEKAEAVSKCETLSDIETLYRTKKGRYFLHRQCPDTNVETIRTITDEEAFEWLGEHDPDKAIELFPWKKVEDA